MKLTKIKNVILAIETAVGGGSLALLAGGAPLDFWNGDRRASKAEDLLEQIGEMLRRNSIRKDEIELICVSKDAGSLTGEKIGRSIARGLSRAFGCRTIECSPFDALLQEYAGRTIDGYVTAAFGSGEEYFIWQRRRIQRGHLSEAAKTCRDTVEEFYRMAETLTDEQLVIFRQSPPAESPKNHQMDENRFRYIYKDNLAAILGTNCQSQSTASDNETELILSGC